MRNLLFVLALTTASYTTTVAAEAQPALVDQTTAIRAVIEQFRVSIINKDIATFNSLFHEGPITWQQVTEDATLQKLKLKYPKATKAGYHEKYSQKFFAASIADPKDKNEEVFSNIKIDTDGDAASVSFDYKFLENDKETNRGKEYWLLVRTEQGWKITSVIYSSKDVPPTPDSGNGSDNNSESSGGLGLGGLLG